VVFRQWTYGEKQQALRSATSWRRAPTGELQPDVDPWVLNDLMLAATVVEWDLVDEAGKPLPVTVEAMRGIRPPELVEEMIAHTHGLNGVGVEARKK